MGLLHESSANQHKLSANQQTCRIILLLVVLLGTGMVIGDGVLTPAMSGEFFFLLFDCN